VMLVGRLFHARATVTRNDRSLSIAWRKGLRRIWNLSARTHSRLLGPICNLLPLKYKLNCRSSSFIVKSLSSINRTVNFVSRNGVFFSGGCYLQSDVTLFTALVFMVYQLPISTVLTNILLDGSCNNWR